MTSYVVIGVLGAYLLLLLFLGMWGRRESKSVSGYYIAGKKLPSWVIAFSANATGESGWLLLGLTGMGYMVGVHAFWVVLGISPVSTNRRISCLIHGHLRRLSRWKITRARRR